MPNGKAKKMRFRRRGSSMIRAAGETPRYVNRLLAKSLAKEARPARFMGIPVDDVELCPEPVRFDWSVRRNVEVAQVDDVCEVLDELVANSLGHPITR